MNIFRYFKNWKTSYALFKSGQFNSNYYLRKYPEVSRELSSGFFYHLSINKYKFIRLIGKAMIHPIRHYVWKGVYEGKQPSKAFDTIYYIEKHQDVAKSGTNPFLHYVKYGIYEGRQAVPGIKDLTHEFNSLESQVETLRRSKLFDEKYYLRKYIDVANAKVDPVVHYCEFGWREFRNPSEFFDTKYYLDNNKDVLDAGMNPLYHYILFGEEEGRLPRAARIYKRDYTILFVGHEAEKTGAPIILLDIIKWFNKFTSYKVKVVLLKGGPLQQEYERNANTIVLTQYGDRESIKKNVVDFIGNDNCIVFLNTVVSTRFLELVNLSQFPHIAFIHELEKTLREFPKETKMLKKNVRFIIGASDAVTDNLIENHGYSKEEVHPVFAFIDPQHQFFDEEKRRLRRQELNLPTDKILIFGCGTLYWRKNPQGFIEVAEKVFKKTDKEIEFIWIGDGEEKSICERIVKKKNLMESVRFIGTVENPRDYLAAGDIFLLPSIEDPFPLVCLEAADCGLPVVCYADAGGMQRFVEKDAGVVVSFNDTDAMADAIYELVENEELREKMGKTARNKVLNRHVIDKSAQKIKRLIDNEFNISPLVSIIVPNFNHSKYLPQRLDSIYSQTYKDIEVILLDDMSTDNSREILNEYAQNYQEITRKVYNDGNSGSVFLQWQKGLEAARGDIVWIAESDDYCEDNLIESLLPSFNQEEIVLSYANSKIVGPNGEYYNTYDNIPWLTDLDETKWTSDYHNNGTDELLSALAIKNTIPNISAVLLRKEPALKAVKHAISYKKAGDWIFNAYMTRYGHIAYCSDPLNYHRRHGLSVTSKESDDKGVREIYLIHKHFVDNFHIPISTRRQMINFIEKEYSIYRERKSVKKPFEELYHKKDILSATLKPKIALFQHGLNFGKGGAEKILIEKANLLFQRGYDVTIYNRTYSDAPLPFELNPNIPVYAVGIKQDIEDVISKDTKPDVCIINSIGHPDVTNIEQFKRLDIPVILSMHNQPKFFDETPGTKQHNVALQEADCVVTLIPSYKDEYVKRGIDTPIKVIPNFILQPKVKNQFTGLSNKKYIFSAGRLVEQKQHHILIEAFAKLANNLPNWNLLIAGEGHLRPELEKQIKKLDLEERIVLLGEVSNIGDYYKNCDLFVLPSKFEGFSLVVPEVSSFGKPIIVFKDCPPYGEVIKEDDGIILVPEMTSESLAAHINDVILKPDSNIKEKMIQYYRNYSPDTIIPFWEELIVEMAQKHKSKVERVF